VTVDDPTPTPDVDQLLARLAPPGWDPPAVREDERRGHRTVTLSAGPYTATFLPDLGMLGSSLTHDGDELLDRTGGVERYEEGHTTGLPLLHPWANRLEHLWYSSQGVHVDIEPRPPVHLLDGLPIHGTMTARTGWQVELAIVDSTRALLQTRFAFDTPDLLESFPFPHELALFVELNVDLLRVTTTLHATGDRPVPVSFGWHPYLRLPDVPRAELAVELPERVHLALDGRMLPTGEETAEPAETLWLGNKRDADLRRFDDLYRLTGGRELALVGRGRRLAVTLEDGYDHAQVYAPAGQTFVCLEPMTAPVNALVSGDHPVVDPGGTYRATFTVALTDVDRPAPPPL
jgi:galactose mutarotase-like enzyme